MKLKNLLLLILVFGASQISFSQLKQADTVSTYKSIIPVERQSLLSNVDLIANMQFGHSSDWDDGSWQGSKFNMNQFRMEIRGWVTEKLHFRFRHRYTSSFEPQSVDNIIKGVDYAALTFKVNEKWSITAGKMATDWGGIEFDLNPIDIYTYSDIIEQADNYLAGVGATYQATKDHSFGLQLLNPRTQTAEEIYGEDVIIGGDIETAKAPWAGVFNWRGSFFDGKLNTLWHYSVFNEGDDDFQNYMAFGQQLNLNKWSIAYDYKLSLEDVDRTGIIRNLISTNDQTYVLRNTRYESHWLSVQHRIHPQWQLSLTAFVDFSSVKNEMGDYKKVRNAYSYIPAIEYYPFKDYNVKLFVNYVGRVFRYTDFAEDTFNLSNGDTGRLSFGIITPLNFL
ncbi:MAG: porin [Psychroflexus halocasei]|uniref:porin n=1 Tax=Psychroflexus sp. S27 TaxID=1982757 RepID=UPI001863DA08|nr:porin [Psychroflexus sp. S27]